MMLTIFSSNAYLEYFLMANIIVSGLDVSISDIVTLIYRSSLNDSNNN
jgi:hypothetical protein